jgi:hypothetical protein
MSSFFFENQFIEGMLFSDWTLVKMGEATWAVEKEDLRINKW